MNRQISLEEMIAKNEAAKREYQEILEAGMLLQLFPQLTGDWNRDEVAWYAAYDLILKLREEGL